MRTCTHSGTTSRSRSVSIPLARSAITGDGSGNTRMRYSAWLPNTIAHCRAVKICEGIGPPLKNGRLTVGRVVYSYLQGWSPPSDRGGPSEGSSPPMKNGRQTIGSVFYSQLQGWSPSSSGGNPGERSTLYLNILWWLRE